MRSPLRHLPWLLLPLHACSEPTYVSVHITTDVPCERLQGLTLTFGALGSLEDKVPATRTAQCNGGDIGTITVVPSASDDSEFGVRVVMGIERDVESCTAPSYGDGCVVSRRGLRFLPGESVTLPIVMRQICNGIPCGPYDTCVRGTCVPATCKDSNSCTEDKLAENAQSTGDGGLDGPPGDGPVLGPDREPPEILHAYCGTSEVLDRNAAWPIRRGCLSRAGVTRFRGPIEQGLVAEGIVSTSWSALAVDDGTSGWGVTQNEPSLVTFGKNAFTQPVDYDPLSAPMPLGPAILGDMILYPHRSGVSTVVRDPQSPGFPRGDYTPTNEFTGGPESFLGAWVPQREGASPPTMLIVRDGSLTTPNAWKLRRVVLTEPPSFTASVDITGTRFSDPAVSPDNTTVYIGSDQSLSAFDPTTGSLKWTVPVETAAVGLVDRAQRFDTLVFLRQDGAPTGDWVLRTYAPSGQVAAADVTIATGVVAGALVDYGLALALVPGAANDIAIVTDGRDVHGIDLTTRSEIWKHRPLGNGGRAQIVSTPNVTYVASSGNLMAISPKDGAVLFTHGAVWGPPTDMAIGPGHTLYVSEQVLLYRAGPRLL